MVTRLRNRFKFWIERQMVRGARYRLLVIAAAIGLISVFGGALVLAAGTGFENLGEAVWWAFLRLSDPGYLGDDVGTVNRTVSTVITVLGYVVFLGALVAVMTQWLQARMQRLEAGLTPVARNDHVLVLGWTNRTEAVVRELLLSEGRVRRFLRRQGARDLHIVVLVEAVDARLVQDLEDAVGEAWDDRKVTLRSGSPLRIEHLERVDYRNAAAILIPASEFGPGGAASVDTRTVKILLSLAHAGGADGADRPLPYAVSEIFDARKLPVARRAYGGELEVVASDAVVSRLLAQNARHPGLSRVYTELLTRGDGNEIYIRELPELAGRTFEELAGLFSRSILLGAVRREGDSYRTFLNPRPGFRVAEGDRLVLLARAYDDAVPVRGATPLPARRGEPRAAAPGTGTRRRILILGWSHKVPSLIAEFGTYPGERFDIHVLSRVPVDRREKVLARYGVGGDRIRLRHSEGDYAEQTELEAADPGGQDVVLLVGSDRLRSEDESDARTILGHLLLQEMLAGGARTAAPTEAGTGERPVVIVELLDPENVPLLDAGRGEVIISPLILSHVLAHVALRRELRAVFDELFTAGGAEISFRPATTYGLEGPAVTFRALGEAALARGEIAIGLRSGPGAGGLHLNPPASAEWTLREALQVVTVETYA